MKHIIALVIVVVAVCLAVSSMFVIVDQRHIAIISSNGGENPVAMGPGAHFKWPPPLQRALLIDTRVQTFDPQGSHHYTTADKTDLLVSAVSEYRITDPLKLFNETKGDPHSAVAQLAAEARSALGNAFDKRALSDVLAQQHAIADEVRAALQAHAAALGIDIVDIVLTRIDFPAAMTDAVYKRMNAASEQLADREREQSVTDVDQINADAERERQAVLAQAYNTAQLMKGEGDAKAASIAAEAFGRDPAFYRFYQSLQAYRSVFKPNDVVVVDSNSAFFQFMHDPSGANASALPSTSVLRKH